MLHSEKERVGAYPLILLVDRLKREKKIMKNDFFIIKF